MSGTEPEIAGTEPEIVERHGRRWWIGIVVVLVLAVAVFFYIRSNREASGPQPPVLGTVIDQPISGEAVTTRWDIPSAVDVVGESVYVLDSGNNRILVMDREGVTNQIICETGECAFLLDDPQDMEVHDGRIFVANTEAGAVEVLDDTGNILQRYLLPDAAGDEPPRATGLYVSGDGVVYVADGTSGRIAMFEPGGEFFQYFGEDTVGVFEFDQPRGITFDDAGNLYVAEFASGRVRKISPEGRDLATYSMMGGPTNASQPTDVALADNGVLYVADYKRSLVHVFSRSARYVGIVGLFDASRRGSPIALKAPLGLDVVGDEIFVIDADRGLLVFTVDMGYFVSEADV